MPSEKSGEMARLFDRKVTNKYSLQEKKSISEWREFDGLQWQNTTLESTPVNQEQESGLREVTV